MALLYTTSEKLSQTRDSLKGLYQIIFLEIDSWLQALEFKQTLLKQFSDSPEDWASFQYASKVQAFLLYKIWVTDESRLQSGNLSGY